ncbi:phage tail protein [Photorhabdus viridis]|uniref:phage tail protein n=1 Tax=Photorhabdus viridis TaxID=3163327 RepID=UPI003306A456
MPLKSGTLATLDDITVNAVPNSRKVNGKALTGDVNLSAGDVCALGQLNNGNKFQDFLSAGFAVVNVPNIATVSDFPFPSDFYSFGILEVQAEYSVITQRYTSHTGQIAIRQSWDSGKTWKGWYVVYSSTMLPPEQHPVGSPIPWPQPNPPSGYLTCNGQAFNKSTYPQLAAAYPSGTLPDLRGEFIRGWDDGRGVDSGRGVLSWQHYDIHSHSHGGVFTGALERESHGSGGWGAMNTNGTTEAAGGAETRPRNIAFNYIVRAA